NVAESLDEGARVVAQGRLKQRSFTVREGNNRTSIEVDVDEIGASLKYATAEANRVQRGGGGRGGVGGGPQGGGQGGYGNQGGYQGAPQGAPAADPWAGGGNQGGYDDPPF